jgi:adenosine deaminase
MRPQTVIDLARANGVPLPTSDPTELYRSDSLDSFLEIFWLVQSTLTTRADWARLGYEAVLDSAAHGVIHQECFFTPARHLAAGLSLEEILAGLDEGIAAGEAETGTTCLLIGDMDRAFGPAAGLVFVEELVALRRAGAVGADRVIGVGMDSTELGIDSTTFLPGYQAARAARLRLTGHQGENSTAADIAACLDVLGLERIDHAFPALTDPELTSRLAGERTPITICPTSKRGHRQLLRPDRGPCLPTDARSGAAGHREHRRPCAQRHEPGSGVRRGRPRLQLRLGPDGGDRARRRRGLLA